MTERNPITGDPILFAPGRDDRPNLFRSGGQRCPFCAGHEADTPPEIWRDGDPWRIRVVPNKYPASAQHEVIVETPDHNATFDQLPPEHAAGVVASYIDRYYSMAGAAQAVFIFKNHGPLAGASISHLHSQVLGTPFTPPRTAREAAMFTARARCPLCSLLDHALIAETEHFRWIAPRGAAFAYEQWIVPRQHAPEFREAHELPLLLQRASRSMLTLGDSFNWMFMNFAHQPAAHWYVQLLPRRAAQAGFELASGSGINAVDAAETARRIAAGAAEEK